jgi:tetratricopeptide (TPR) repeat protein
MFGLIFCLSFGQNKDYETLVTKLTTMLERQKQHPNTGNNQYLAGITAHNLVVVKLLAGHDDDALSLLEEAISLKEAAFGTDHFEVGLTWDELGIQYFARSRFEDALAAFRKAHMCRSKTGTSPQTGLDMVLNNMACCNFQMRNHRTALLQLHEARDIQQQALSTAAQADLDLLHVAVVMCNCGYLHLCLKEYDEARSQLEEALLIQQSVLDDNHRAVRDTISNIDFANAFHS